MVEYNVVVYCTVVLLMPGRIGVNTLIKPNLLYLFSASVIKSKCEIKSIAK